VRCPIDEVGRRLMLTHRSVLEWISCEALNFRPEVRKKMVIVLKRKLQAVDAYCN